MKASSKILAGLGLLVGVFIAARKLVESTGSAIKEATGALGDVTQEVNEWFDAFAWECYVPSGENTEIVDYWKAHAMTAEEVAEAVHAGLTLPIIGKMTYPAGFSFLANGYQNTKESQVFGSGGGIFGLGNDDKIYDLAKYATARDWAAGQLELYTSWGEEFGYTMG